MDELIIDLYKKGVSLKGIVDKVFKANKNNISLNNSYRNYRLYEDRKYTRLDCLSYVSRIILNYNRLNRK